MRRFLILYLLVSAIGCKTVKNNSVDSQKIVWMKDYSFCKCLTYSYNDSISNKIQEVDHSISTLTDIANIWGNYPELDSMAKNYANSIPETQILDYNDMKPYMFRCLEYRRSESLDSLVKNLLTKKE